MRQEIDDTTTAVLMTFSLGDVLALLGVIVAAATVWWRIHIYVADELAKLHDRINATQAEYVRRTELDRDLRNFEKSLADMRTELNARLDIIMAALNRTPPS